MIWYYDYLEEDKRSHGILRCTDLVVDKGRNCSAAGTAHVGSVGQATELKVSKVIERGSEKETYSVISKRRHAFLHPALRMIIASNKPKKGNQEDSSHNGPFNSRCILQVIISTMSGRSESSRLRCTCR